MMFFSGTPASRNPSTTAATTSGFVPLTERPEAETLIPTLSSGETKDCHASDGVLFPVTPQTRLSTMRRTIRG